jgi:spore coat polysaccharide biosynthesis protein SpsF
VIEAYCRSNSVLFYRGHPENVLSRYFEAAKKHNIDIIVRITADCPLIDPQIVDRMVEAFFKLNVLRVFDYLSNTIQRTFPRGLDAEIFLFTTLKKAFYQASSDYEREHVTPFIYEHSKWFKTKNYVEQGQKDYSSHRWTVDTIEDFNLIEEIYKALYSQKKLFLLEDVIKLFSERPELMKINEEVQQKDLGE